MERLATARNYLLHTARPRWKPLAITTTLPAAARRGQGRAGAIPHRQRRLATARARARSCARQRPGPGNERRPADRRGRRAGVASRGRRRNRLPAGYLRLFRRRAGASSCLRPRRRHAFWWAADGLDERWPFLDEPAPSCLAPLALCRAGTRPWLHATTEALLAELAEVHEPLAGK